MLLIDITKINPIKESRSQHSLGLQKANLTLIYLKITFKF
jgi:hypothetical protein